MNGPGARGTTAGPAPRTLSIIAAAAPGDVVQIRALFREYEEFLNVDLCFQGFDEELATLPGKYAPPDGALLLALVDGEVAGCVALRPLEPGVCEMKRLFVRPAFRGLGLGRALAERIIEESRKIGYVRMKLDTLGFLKGAIHLYRTLGFEQTGAYYENPLEEVMYWELDLERR